MTRSLRARPPKTGVTTLLACCWLAACDDAKPPGPTFSFTVVSPDAGARTGERLLLVRGDLLPHSACEGTITGTNATTGATFEGRLETHGTCWDNWCACTGSDGWTARVPLVLGTNVLRFQIVGVDVQGMEGYQRASATLSVELVDELIPPVVRITSPTGAPAFATAQPVATIGGTAADAASMVGWDNATTGAHGDVGGIPAGWLASVPLAPCSANAISVTADNGHGVTRSATIEVTSTFGVTSPPGGSVSCDYDSIRVGGCAPSGSTRTAWRNVTTGSSGWFWAGPSWTSDVLELVSGTNELEFTLDPDGPASATQRLSVMFTRPPGLTVYTQSGAGHDVVVLSGWSRWAHRVTWTNEATGADGEVPPTGTWNAAVPLVPGSNRLVVTAAGAGAAPPTATADVTLSYDPAPPSSVWTWGTYYSYDVAPAPYPVGAIPAARAVASGRMHACAVREDGRVVCWGNNIDLALGSTDPFARSVVVADVPDAVGVAVGPAHGCALTTAATVWCWGNGGGCPNLCEPGTFGAAPHVVVLPPARELVGGGGWTCAILESSGAVTCWDGSAMREQPGLAGATAIAVGPFGVCGVLPGGAVACGRPDAPQDGAAEVGGLGGVERISVGYVHACAARADGTVACWGANGAGQLGDGTRESRAEPVVVAGLSDATAIAAGWKHSCALRRGGTVVCWGANSDGQLGDGTLVDSLVPVAVAGLSGVTALAAGEVSGVAIRP